MTKVVALRGVCVGVGRHLQPGDEADLDDATVQFLTGINAVKVAPPPAPPAAVIQPPPPPPAAVVATPKDSPVKGAQAPKKGT